MQFWMQINNNSLFYISTILILIYQKVKLLKIKKLLKKDKTCISARAR